MAIRADYAKHSRAAYEIALEFFEAEKVLASLLERAGFRSSRSGGERGSWLRQYFDSVGMQQSQPIPASSWM